MKANLMFKDQDFDLGRQLSSQEQALTQDLELNVLFAAMSHDDKFILDVSKKAVFLSLTDPNEIRYRQEILKDCLKNPAVIRSIYNLTIQSLEKERRSYFSVFSKYPSSILFGAIEVMKIFVDILQELKTIVAEHADKFESAGFATFFTMLEKELTDEYIASVQNHLKELKFPDGVLLSADLQKGNKGGNYVLHKLDGKKTGWLRRIFSTKLSAFTLYISDRDESGARALREITDQGINLVANALAQSADHIRNFLKMLGTELAFYVGCINLYDELVRVGEPLTFPLTAASDEHRYVCKGLYDPCLALTMKHKAVGNDFQADQKDLVIITGANQGGKSIFLRSIGLSQLMMQCGMFVAAESFSASVCEGIFTHYRRKEDAAMNSGKLDEELSRMSDIVNHIRANSLVLFNESFAATNEREGSEIARQIISAFLDNQVKVFFVTHLYDFAHSFFDKKMNNVIFLRAERQSDGGRTFKLNEGEPLPTSFGEDLYHRIFV